MIRLATTEDVEDVVRIMNQGIEERRNAYLNAFVNDQGAHWYKALTESPFYLVVKENKEGQVCGWGCLSAYRTGRDAFLHVAEITFYFDRTGRGKGWGAEMIRHLESVAKDLSKQHLVAILLDDNVPSQGLLRKLGYDVWANFKDLAVFPDGNRGHLYMGKQLD